ncbi:hypothetical protein [Desulfovibrio litoralis]|uniref:Uncharacterized protein n=1 Tax=Desulfovibrio litoralis DSM 11393 TaxID=1121455 RepID=A0A1M7SGX4_9BACT|nr:hypothetical protein [Desulfovibrio litoralis]SHN57700.1 hypothetical protein SAMN02745728_00937 [Desulfovibrio litoralis DSM 11393]
MKLFAKSLKVIWILCSLIVLAVTLFYASPNTPNDIFIFLWYGMGVLTFPSNFLVAGLLVGLILIEEQTGIQFLTDSNYVGLSSFWLALFIVGYIQWFVLVPWLWHKIRKR